MEIERPVKQPEIIPSIPKRILRKPVNQVGFAMLLQTAIQMITVIVIQGILVAGLTITSVLQSQVSGNEFNSQLFTEEMIKTVTQPLVLIVCLLASSLLGNTIPYLLCAKKIGIKLKSLYRKSDISFSYIAKMSVITIAAGTIFSYFQYIFDFLLKPFNLHSTSPDVLKFPIGSSLAIGLYFLSVCIVAPLTEEYIFRGIILNVFKKYGTGFAIVASSLFFGLFHANLYQTPYAVVTGLLLAYVAVETQSIIPSTILHFINNTTSFILSAFSACFPKYDSIISLAFDGIIVPVGIILFFIWYKKRKKFGNDFVQSPGISGAKLIFTSWSCLITIVVYVIFTIMSIKPLS